MLHQAPKQTAAGTRNTDFFQYLLKTLRPLEFINDQRKLTLTNIPKLAYRMAEIWILTSPYDVNSPAVSDNICHNSLHYFHIPATRLIGYQVVCFQLFGIIGHFANPGFFLVVYLVAELPAQDCFVIFIFNACIMVFTIHKGFQQ